MADEAPTIATIEDTIREVLLSDHVSFAELQRIPGFKGDLEICSAKYPNIIFWAGVSRPAIQAMDRLIDAGEFHYHASTYLVYLADGCFLRLPIAKRAVDYKTPHWLPVCLKRGKGPCPGCERHHRIRHGK